MSNYENVKIKVESVTKLAKQNFGCNAISPPIQNINDELRDNGELSDEARNDLTNLLMKQEPVVAEMLNNNAETYWCWLLVEVDRTKTGTLITPPFTIESKLKKFNKIISEKVLQENPDEIDSHEFKLWLHQQLKFYTTAPKTIEQGGKLFVQYKWLAQ